jgi:hypothetical protein
MDTNYPQNSENASNARVRVSEIQFLSALKPLAGVFETMRIRFQNGNGTIFWE